MMIKVDDFNYMVHSTVERLVGSEVGLYISPENIHIMRKG